MDETFSQQYYRKNPEKKKTYILGDKKVNFSEYVDIGGVSSYLDRLYENVDVYQNNISLLSNTFLSPIADMAPSYYRFYIADTTVIDGTKLVRLNFSPKNLNNLLSFNKIPLLKKLKLREVASAKILYGGVRNENNPDFNLSTFTFPVDKESNFANYLYT